MTHGAGAGRGRHGRHVHGPRGAAGRRAARRQGLLDAAGLRARHRRRRPRPPASTRAPSATSRTAPRSTTNAIITKRGARTGLVTTAGFRDVLELRRHNRGDLYDIGWDPPPPLVPRRDRLEVRERTAYDGAEVEPLDEDDVARVVALAQARGWEAAAVVFLHCYAAPGARAAHARARSQAALPDAYVVASAEILPEEQEFERTSTDGRQRLPRADLPRLRGAASATRSPRRASAARSSSCTPAAGCSPRAVDGAAAGAHRDLGPGGGRHRGRGDRRGGRAAQPADHRHRRHERRHRRRCATGQLGLARQSMPEFGLPDPLPGHRPRDDGRRRRLHRLARPRRLAQGRAAERRRGAGPGGLRPRRHATPR